MTQGPDFLVAGAGDDPGPVARPYTITGATGGRLRSWHSELELETLVVTSALGEAAPNLGFERRAIVRLCQDLQSIAEVSTRLHLPLAVARALVGDMGDEGLVAVYRPAKADAPPDVALLKRVLDGLYGI